MAQLAGVTLLGDPALAYSMPHASTILYQDSLPGALAALPVLLLGSLRLHNAGAPAYTPSGTNTFCTQTHDTQAWTETVPSIDQRALQHHRTNPRMPKCQHVMGTQLYCCTQIWQL
jgi:hypothetical protein